jgi:hypothetical protein
MRRRQKAKGKRQKWEIRVSGEKKSLKGKNNKSNWEIKNFSIFFFLLFLPFAF